MQKTLIFLSGVVFAFLCASATIATKIGIRFADPLVFAVARLIVAGIILLMFSIIIKKEKLPQGKEWISLIKLGLLNTTINLGAFFIAMQHVSAGLANLFLAIIPLLIVLLSVIFLKKRIRLFEILGLIICFVGLSAATIPSLHEEQSSVAGIVFLSACILSYAGAGVYYANLKVKLSAWAINAWQILLGGILLIPLAVTGSHQKIVYNYGLVLTFAWLTFGISIGAMALWFYLLKIDTVNAGKWLYLSPVIGYFLSRLILNEKISHYEMMATALVLVGLLISSIVADAGSREK